MARYALAEHVFICVSGDHLVILDLKEDRYWALEAARTAGLGALVRGWPVDAPGTNASPGTSSPEAAAAIDVLRGRGIVTEDNESGKDARPVTAIVPARELTSETDKSPGERIGSWLAFFKACAFAKLALRAWPFERVIRRARRRKALMEPKAGPLDAERARKLVQAFARYRVFLFSSRNECLFDSLALIEFLARYDIYPDWVFGVQTRPFAAHCWVQHGDIVFNDTAEHVSGYTPIMVV